MARRTFFSFHYKKDVTRAHVVRNSWVTKNDREAAGFFDGSAFEKAEKEGVDNLKNFLRDQLRGASVTCVLIGAETYSRRWVKYEILRSFQQAKGLLGVHVDWIKDLNGAYCDRGSNPFDYLRTDRVGDTIYWQEYLASEWKDTFDVPAVKETEIPWTLGTEKHKRFSDIFPVYCWKNDDGYSNLGTWIERAAIKAGR